MDFIFDFQKSYLKLCAESVKFVVFNKIMKSELLGIIVPGFGPNYQLYDKSNFIQSRDVSAVCHFDRRSDN